MKQLSYIVVSYIFGQSPWNIHVYICTQSKQNLHNFCNTIQTFIQNDSGGNGMFLIANCSTIKHLLGKVLTILNLILKLVQGFSLYLEYIYLTNEL